MAASLVNLESPSGPRAAVGLLHVSFKTLNAYVNIERKEYTESKLYEKKPRVITRS